MSETLIWVEATIRLASQAYISACESGEDPSSGWEKRMAAVHQRWGEAHPNIPEFMRDGIWNMLCEQPEWVQAQQPKVVELKETLAEKSNLLARKTSELRREA